MMQRSMVLGILSVLVASCTDDSEPNPPAQGGSAELTFAGISGSNLDTNPLPPTDVGLVFRDPASQTRVIGVFAYELQLDGFKRKSWQLALSISGDPVAGATYTIATPSSGSATLEYDESPASGGFRSWEATGGSIAVESLSGSQATFSLSSIPMVVSTGGSGNGATGTFALSGTITVDNIE